MNVEYFRIHGGVRYNMVASFIGSKANPSRVLYWISNPTKVWWWWWWWWWWPSYYRLNEKNLFGGYFEYDWLNTIFIIMGKFHDFGKIKFRLSRPKLYPLGTF
jgi:hypothetical protein